MLKYTSNEFFFFFFVVDYHRALSGLIHLFLYMFLTTMIKKHTAASNTIWIATGFNMKEVCVVPDTVKLLLISNLNFCKVTSICIIRVCHSFV